MGNAREHFLDTVRRAVAEGNRAGQVPGHPDRGGVGYQGGGPDPLRRFAEECRAAGGQVHVVPDPAAAVARILALLNAAGVLCIIVPAAMVMFLNRYIISGILAGGVK